MINIELNLKCQRALIEVIYVEILLIIVRKQISSHLKIKSPTK